MTDIAIKVENLSKLYKIGARQQGYKTLRESVMGSLRAPFCRLAERARRKANPAKRSALGALRSSSDARLRAPCSMQSSQSDDHIWALKDVSFEVKQGEVVGIIGRNGAGKTTLLKILSRITEPTQGRAEIHGRVGSLLEVGTGFHPELTGRENIYLNGAILGMRKAEIERKFHEIVAFSEIEKFIDTPVKRYSSGMYVRLAFAVAAYLEPEVLVVDEVLAVGDAAFQKKCLGKMGDVAKEGRTVLFVSHNMGAVKALCGCAILLDGGSIVKSGFPNEVISFYLTQDTESEAVMSATWVNRSDLCNESSEVTLLSVVLIDLSETPRNSYTSEEIVRIVVCYRVNVQVVGLRTVVQVQTSEGVVAFTTYEDSTVIDGTTVSPGKYRSECQLPPNLLNIDVYSIMVAIDLPRIKVIVPVTPTVKLQVLDTTSHFRYHRTPQGAVRPKLKWITHTLVANEEVYVESDPE